MSENQQQNQIQIKADDKALVGKFANMMQVVHNEQEFVLDFVSMLPPQAQLVSRVIITPAHAKQIAAALQENIRLYEEKFSKISSQEEPKSNFGFKTE